MSDRISIRMNRDSGHDGFRTGKKYQIIIAGTKTAEDIDILSEGGVIVNSQSPERVRILETYLNTLGYLTKSPDGVFDADTKSALEGFQSAWNLEIDGQCGPNTKKVIKKALSGEKPPIKTEPEDDPVVDASEWGAKFVEYAKKTYAGIYYDPSGCDVSLMKPHSPCNKLKYESAHTKAGHSKETICGKGHGVCNELVFATIHHFGLPAFSNPCRTNKDWHKTFKAPSGQFWRNLKPDAKTSGWERVLDHVTLASLIAKGQADSGLKLGDVMVSFHAESSDSGYGHVAFYVRHEGTSKMIMYDSNCPKTQVMEHKIGGWWNPAVYISTYRYTGK